MSKERKLIIALVSLAFVVALAFAPISPEKVKPIQDAVENVVDAALDEPTTQPAAQPVTEGGAP